MEAGRELDAEIALALIGWPVVVQSYPFTLNFTVDRAKYLGDFLSRHLYEVTVDGGRRLDVWVAAHYERREHCTDWVLPTYRLRLDIQQAEPELAEIVRRRCAET